MSTLGLIYVAAGLLALFGAVALRWPDALGPTARPLVGITGMLFGWFTPQILIAGLLFTAAMGGGLARPLGLVGLALHGAAWAVTISAVVLWRTASLSLEGAEISPPGGPWLPFLFPRLRPGPDVLVERGLLWREAGARLRMDVTRPRIPPDRRPPIIMLHGGGWVTGRRKQGRFLAAELAKRGWTVLSVSYRRAPRFPLPAAYEDAVAAVQMARERAESLGALDFPPIVIGSSAGGHLAAMLALRGPRDGAEVSAAVCLYPPIDVERVFRTRHAWGPAMFLERMVFLARYAEDPEPFRAMAPLRFAHGGAPPMLLIHGDADGLVPQDESARLYDALRAVDAPVSRLVVPHMPHAFEIFPGPGLYRILPTILQFLDRFRAGA